MQGQNNVLRRSFIGGLATALTCAGAYPHLTFPAQNRSQHKSDDYDRMAKLSFNENPYGPSDVVMKAMTDAFKYANRYGYPDGGITEAIAKHHGVKPENVLLGAGSGEILKVADDTFLIDHKKVVGVDPTFASVYQFAVNSRAEAIKIPLLKDYRMDIPGIISSVKNNYRDVGFVYVVNPNNPTGNIIPKQEIQLLLDSIPGDVPVLIDEAYHHFVDDPNYATSVPYVIEGRQVIVTRTFSKISALAGMRLGYGLAPKELTDRMRPFANGSINAIVKWGGVAALNDTATQDWTKKTTLALRKKVTDQLTGLGYSVIPSETNFFMVHVRRDITPIVAEFEKKGVLVGRMFPPLVEHLRVSIGTAEEMDRFMTAFKEIFKQS
jgi:histidinol-phosphate aminotransferase